MSAHGDVDATDSYRLLAHVGEELIEAWAGGEPLASRLDSEPIHQGVLLRELSCRVAQADGPERSPRGVHCRTRMQAGGNHRIVESSASRASNVNRTGWLNS
jgi:predicted RecB family endonuclease